MEEKPCDVVAIRFPIGKSASTSSNINSGLTSGKYMKNYVQMPFLGLLQQS